ncbi:helix-turn-helix transcriptional regulator [Gryllotalpicola protaetiae]|uniref:XRE family transcriptional regulator n=1 Tax=Gryllotalpicola protaetiae TaxID=2419771 RepID=A0A387BT53_9MICO|nr:helix-turn-helix transcriptional regulator [Gryllotalpicola protaetiae]AYG04216.1 XRE family transcriptional regulator [Gryllotalpicola protaetiae]
MAQGNVDLVTVGRRIRHFRTARGLTLDQLGAKVEAAPSQLSLVENGRREPKLSLLRALAAALEVELSELISDEAPDARSALEIELTRAQASVLYASTGLPVVRPTRGTPTEVLEALVGMHRELARRTREQIATPEQARRANTEQRERMRAQDNYLPDIEQEAEDRVKATGHTQGALTHREVATMAEQLGFELLYVDDLPRSTRSITDLEHGRIFLPPASIPGGHGLRSMALQAIAHRVLGHEAPGDYATFLKQRLEINYFAAACLMPRSAAVAYLQGAKKRRELAVDDFRDAFGTTHESAAMRLTNLATAHLDLKVHFLRVGYDGAIYRVYENDGLPLPADVTGAVEGQFACRKFGARAALASNQHTTALAQYTDTPAGTFWCETQVGSGDDGRFSITFGVPFDDAKWFRGRETTVRAVSTCPDPRCCQNAPDELEERWHRAAWPSARAHTHILSPLPSGNFPGVDDAELYEFLERHSAPE